MNIFDWFSRTFVKFFDQFIKNFERKFVNIFNRFIERSVNIFDRFMRRFMNLFDWFKICQSFWWINCKICESFWSIHYKFCESFWFVKIRFFFQCFYTKSLKYLWGFFSDRFIKRFERVIFWCIRHWSCFMFVIFVLVVCQQKWVVNLLFLHHFTIFISHYIQFRQQVHYLAKAISSTTVDLLYRFSSDFEHFTLSLFSRCSISMNLPL